MPNVMFPWETFPEKAKREKRERENDNTRWTDEFCQEVKEHIREYEAELDKGFGERCVAVANLMDVYENVPFHFRRDLRGKLFSAKSMEVIDRCLERRKSY